MDENSTGILVVTLIRILLFIQSTYFQKAIMLRNKIEHTITNHKGGSYEE